MNRTDLGGMRNTLLSLAIKRKNISSGTYGVILMLLAHSNMRTGEVFGGKAEMARQTGMSPANFRRTCRWLVDEGILREDQSSNGGGLAYFVVGLENWEGRVVPSGQSLENTYSDGEGGRY